MKEQDKPPGWPGAGDPEQHPAFELDESFARETPSQAEGDRDTIEQDVAEKLDGAQPGERYATGGGGQGDLVITPSQAEGDRDVVEEDLREKGEE